MGNLNVKTSKQMDTYPTNINDSIIESLSKGVLNLGNECRALSDENARLKAEVEELTGLLKASTYYNSSEEVTRLKAEVKRLTKAVMHSPAAQLKLKELEGKTTYEEINPDNQ